MYGPPRPVPAPERHHVAAFSALVCLMGVSVTIACADFIGPAGSSATVDVRVAPVVQAELSLLTDFAFDAEVINTGSATVVYDRWCNWRLQQLVNGAWAPAYAPLCSPEGREINQLWFGELAVHRYPAHRSWRTGNGAQVVGTYRLVMSVHTGEAGTELTDLREVVVTSNSFTVR